MAGTVLCHHFQIILKTGTQSGPILLRDDGVVPFEVHFHPSVISMSVLFQCRGDIHHKCLQDLVLSISDNTV